MNGNELRARRKKIYISQAEFARLLGVSKGYLNNIERGSSNNPQFIRIALQHLRSIEETQRRYLSALQQSERLNAQPEELEPIA